MHLSDTIGGYLALSQAYKRGSMHSFQKVGWVSRIGQVSEAMHVGER